MLFSPEGWNLALILTLLTNPADGRYRAWVFVSVLY